MSEWCARLFPLVAIVTSAVTKICANWVQYRNRLVGRFQTWDRWRCRAILSRRWPFTKTKYAVGEQKCNYRFGMNEWMNEWLSERANEQIVSVCPSASVQRLFVSFFYLFSAAHHRPSEEWVCVISFFGHDRAASEVPFVRPYWFVFRPRLFIPPLKKKKKEKRGVVSSFPLYLPLTFHYFMLTFDLMPFLCWHFTFHLGPCFDFSSLPAQPLRVDLWPLHGDLWPFFSLHRPWSILRHIFTSASVARPSTRLEIGPSHWLSTFVVALSNLSTVFCTTCCERTDSTETRRRTRGWSSLHQNEDFPCDRSTPIYHSASLALSPLCPFFVFVDLCRNLYRPEESWATRPELLTCTCLFFFS